MYKIYSRTGIVNIVMCLLLAVTSCNKINEPVASTPPVYDTTKTVGKLIEANVSYSIFTAALKRTGMYTFINTPSNNFTVYAPTDAAFTSAGISLAVVNAMPLQQLVPLIRHHILQNEKLMAANIATSTPSAPNMPRISALAIGVLPVFPNSPVWMPLYPSKNAVTTYINNIPIAAADVMNAVNGVVHTPFTLVAPPTKVLWDTISNDPDLAYFKAAIQRADSGYATTGSPSFQYALSTGALNLGVFAPTNAAFQAILTALITQGLVAQGVPLATAQATAAALAASPTVFSNPALYPAITAATVRGIVAYHLMGARVFAVNVASTPASYKTFVNLFVPSHPGVALSSTLVSGFGAALTVKGVGNATAANAIAGSPLGVDRLAVNGNFFKIDQVLLPQ